MVHTVHHACAKIGGQTEVLKNFPFQSIYDSENGHFPFLGQGYYFWDFNFEYAKIWGKIHYNNSFFVCEGDIEIDEKQPGHYLDLVGNRKQLVQFVDLLHEFQLIEPNGTKGIDICYIIEYLRKLSKEASKDIFPYRIIRAIDYTNDESKGIQIKFNSTLKSYTFLNPRILISFLNKDDIVFINKPLIKFASPN